MKQSPEKFVSLKAVSEADVASAKRIKVAGATTSKVEAGAALATEVEVSVPLALVVDQVRADVLPADFHDPADHNER
jgi:hypothetical protein